MKKVIEVKNLKKAFGDNVVLKDINLSIYDKQIVSIIGASGSGKSTLLRCMNLLEDADSGEIFLKKQIFYKEKSISIKSVLILVWFFKVLIFLII